ncbi:MAG: hypothetical protein U0Q12_20820 [Vicinamibacterales bacterium]
MTSSTQTIASPARHNAPAELAVVCAWCGHELHRPIGAPQPWRVSHGICLPCVERVTATVTSASFSVFIDS